MTPLTVNVSLLSVQPVGAVPPDITDTLATHPAIAFSAVRRFIRPRASPGAGHPHGEGSQLARADMRQEPDAKCSYYPVCSAAPADLQLQRSAPTPCVSEERDCSYGHFITLRLRCFPQGNTPCCMTAMQFQLLQALRRLMERRSRAKKCPRCDDIGFIVIESPTGTSAALRCTHQPETAQERAIIATAQEKLAHYYDWKVTRRPKLIPGGSTVGDFQR